MAAILLVDDDQSAATAATEFLESRGYDVTMVPDGEAGLRALDREQFDLVILDLAMPKIDGVALCRIFRSSERYVPIVMLTGQSDLNDKLVSYEAGVDAYLTKPISFEELLANVKALLRLVDRVRTVEEPSRGMLHVGHLQLDLEKRSAVKDGVAIALTAREFDLLAFLARYPGKVFSRLQLLQEVWGYKHECYMHTVDSHVNRLRNKIEENSSKPHLILTVWGIGYKLNDILS